MIMRLLVICVSLIVLSCSSSKPTRSNYTTNSSRVSSNSKSEKSSRVTYNTTPVESNVAKGVETAGYTKKGEDISADALLTSVIVTEAEKLIGVEYRYAGTTPSRGFDCSGFTSYVYDKARIGLPRTSTEQSRSGKRKDFDDAETGDLVFFGTGQRVTHVGIVVARSEGKMEIVHSTSSRGVIRNEVYGSDYWRSRKLWAVDKDSLR